MNTLAERQIDDTLLAIDRQRDGSFAFITRADTAEVSIPFDRVNCTTRVIEFFHNGQISATIENHSADWGSVGAWINAEAAEANA